VVIGLDQLSRPDGTAGAGANGGPAISFSHVTKTFRGGTEAVADATFTVAAGEFVSIVGPSGCGKSTLLRLASGLTDITSGTVALTQANVGFVFQEPTLLPWRTVQKNLELLPELHGINRDERRQRAREALALMGLTGFEKHRPRQLSGGMRMRVSLARSLTMRPRIFLFDEPFAALDEITRHRLNDELLRIFLAERFASLFITHSVLEATYLSSRVLVMSARPGRIVADIAVPIGYPRHPEQRFDPALVEVAGEVSARLREVAQ
jgi:NitT/TauT family transport system ATP-binding protein